MAAFWVIQYMSIKTVLNIYHPLSDARVDDCEKCALFAVILVNFVFFVKICSDFDIKL